MEKGEFVAIVGPSGSGKSTLLHILGGVDRPTEGKVYISDTDIHSLSEDKLAIFRRRQIGIVYQFYNLLPVLNVDENIVLPHLLDGRKLDEERLDLVVEQMGRGDNSRGCPSGVPFLTIRLSSSQMSPQGTWIEKMVRKS